MRASFVSSEVVNGLRRNVSMTIAMILTTAVSLTLLGGGLIVVRKVDQAQESLRNAADVVVYMNENVSANDPECANDPCAGLRSELEQASGVQSVQYLNRQAIFDRATEEFSNQPQLQELVRPKALPAALWVELGDNVTPQAVKKQFEGRAGIGSINDQSQFVRNMVNKLNDVRDGTFLIAALQAFAALLLISNTIQLSAFNRRTETGIMRLVGASRWYTQLPFLLEAMVSGIIGSVAATGLLMVLKEAFLDGLMKPLTNANLLTAVSYADVAFVAPILVLVASAISGLTGYLTLRLYVRI
ncbi:cell division transport system permease protein [Actinopolyspora mzabensis]|uniref:Cell division protein FtsX n=1 Tax=Actinopolyspora mzabensis TaxID=995066 RepID=A0A1G8W3H1_ACTMZ|nr:permease-like cell division protein FtsX [Actinopolyspora mzabensis]SDJ72030.1 cell division transport system permease protein [Actinopolyspora mzabensis]